MSDVIAIRHVCFEDLGNFAEVLAARGLSVPQLRRDGRVHGATLEAQGRRCLADWLTGIGGCEGTGQGTAGATADRPGPAV